jgi:tetratricopeptide (TPR) repeat protein
MGRIEDAYRCYEQAIKINEEQNVITRLKMGLLLAEPDNVNVLERGNIEGDKRPMNYFNAALRIMPPNLLALQETKTALNKLVNGDDGEIGGLLKRLSEKISELNRHTPDLYERALAATGINQDGEVKKAEGFVHEGNNGKVPV